MGEARREVVPRLAGRLEDGPLAIDPGEPPRQRPLARDVRQQAGVREREEVALVDAHVLDAVDQRDRIPAHLEASGVEPLRAEGSVLGIDQVSRLNVARVREDGDHATLVLPVDRRREDPVVLAPLPALVDRVENVAPIRQEARLGIVPLGSGRTGRADGDRLPSARRELQDRRVTVRNVEDRSVLPPGGAEAEGHRGEDVALPAGDVDLPELASRKVSDRSAVR